MSSLFVDTIGGLPDDQQNISPARATAKWNHNLRGVEILQLGSTYPGMEVHCTESYLSMFTAGHTYIRSPDNGSWIDTTQKIHHHTGETDEEGGLYRMILHKNSSDYFEMKWEPMRGSGWWQNSSGGNYANTQSGVNIEAEATAGNFMQLANGGHRISFEDMIDFMTKGHLVTANSSMTSFRAGLNCEEVWEISSIRRMFGYEFCDDVDEDRKYMFFSSGGSERNGVVSSLDANNPDSIFISLAFRFIPNSVIKITKDKYQTLMTKGDNIPRSLATSAFHGVKFGVKTNENVAKEYAIKCCRLIGKISELQPW